VLSAAVLSAAVFSAAVLSAAVLSAAVLSAAVLSAAVLSAAVLSAAVLSAAGAWGLAAEHLAHGRETVWVHAPPRPATALLGRDQAGLGEDLGVV